MAAMTSPPKASRAALAFIFVTVFLDVLALGVVIPVLPKLVEGFLGGDTASAAHVYGLFGGVWALMQFFFSPLLGAVSDRFGRRPVILFSNFGLGFDYILMALAPSLWWLFVGRVISGITGASITTAWAYIADVTPPERRAAGYGMVGAAFGLGFVLGPAAGGIFGAVNPRLPFWIAAGLTLANALYGLFVLPESLPRENRAGFRWSRANPLGALQLLRSQPQLVGLASLNFLYWVAHHSLTSVFVLYAGYRYGWGPKTVGMTLAFVGIGSVIVQGGLVRPFVKRFGERVGVITGLTCGAFGFASYGLAPTGHLFWAGIPIFAFMGFFGPSLQGLMTRRVGPSQQGRLQGANASIMGITGVFGPSLFASVFATFIGPRANLHVPGAPFLLASTLMFLGVAIAWQVARVPEAVA
jgi:MFS transporter, DHA1 family, tetracycline resistance protein